VATHFGGVYYLYLRGMSDAPEHKDKGVYYTALAPELLNRIDRLFAGTESQLSGAANNDD
jgi:exodeoxyribonuclease V beta subunit